MTLRFRLIRIVVIFTAAIFLLVVVGSRVQASTTACVNPSIVTWLNTQSDGAAGSFYYNLQFTNLSGKTCTLKGYPTVEGIGVKGSVLGSAASQNPVNKVTSVTLAKGATATAVLRITDVGNYSPAQCKPVTAAGLLVNGVHQIPYPFRACDKIGTNYLSVETYQK